MLDVGQDYGTGVTSAADDIAFPCAAARERAIFGARDARADVVGRVDQRVHRRELVAAAERCVLKSFRRCSFRMVRLS